MYVHVYVSKEKKKNFELFKEKGNFLFSPRNEYILYLQTDRRRRHLENTEIRNVYSTHNCTAKADNEESKKIEVNFVL